MEYDNNILIKKLSVNYLNLMFLLDNIKHINNNMFKNNKINIYSSQFLTEKFSRLYNEFTNNNKHDFKNIDLIFYIVKKGKKVIINILSRQKNINNLKSYLIKFIIDNKIFLFKNISMSTNVFECKVFLELIEDKEFFIDLYGESIIYDFVKFINNLK